MRISHSKIACILSILLLSTVLYACGDKTPPEQPKVSLPQRQTASAAPAEPTEASGGIVQGSINAPANTATTSPVDSFEVAEADASSLYSGEGKVNPFLPLIKADAPVVDPDTGTRRVPQTPLERFDIGQLKLSAIIESPEGNSAIIEESSGRGYVVKPGTYIGLNGGQIKSITREKIIIEEPIGKNERGEVKVNRIELTLPKPAGAL